MFKNAELQVQVNIVERIYLFYYGQNQWNI